ncbi:MAG: phosphoglucosamine mutase, partial [Erysipelotrichaceae bacterium]
MLKQAVCAGLCASGVDAYDMGVVPTPAIAYITTHEDFACGIMISASHNPYYDNGIKVFNTHGVKIDDELETKIEAVIDGQEVPYAESNEIGRVFNYSIGLDHY